MHFFLSLPLTAVPNIQLHSTYSDKSSHNYNYDFPTIDYKYCDHGLALAKHGVWQTVGSQQIFANKIELFGLTLTLGPIRWHRV